MAASSVYSRNITYLFDVFSDRPVYLLTGNVNLFSLFHRLFFNHCAKIVSFTDLYFKYNHWPIKVN